MVDIRNINDLIEVVNSSRPSLDNVEQVRDTIINHPLVCYIREQPEDYEMRLMHSDY